MEKEILAQLTRIADALEMSNVLHGLDTPPAEPKKAEPKKAKPKKAASALTYTHDDLKAVCLDASRKHADNKAKLKALLAEHGASKAVDVPADKLAELIEYIKAEF